MPSSTQTLVEGLHLLSTLQGIGADRSADKAALTLLSLRAEQSCGTLPDIGLPRAATRFNTRLYERDGRTTLNRPEVLNAIDDDLPVEPAAAVAEADADPGVHAMVLAGSGPAFCAGDDLGYYAGKEVGNTVVQDMPWVPIQDYAFMWRNTEHFMSLWRAMEPVIGKAHGYAIAGGSDIALCADLTYLSLTTRESGTCVQQIGAQVELSPGAPRSR